MLIGAHFWAWTFSQSKYAFCQEELCVMTPLSMAVGLHINESLCASVTVSISLQNPIILKGTHFSTLYAF